ncbi:MAG TPA: class I SAM-dependent methyltransferase [Streptosporangiaceae bacterium]|nr:class I SAM-dependent methyltransferase [Streptosporangiaceae bacterium]
MTCERDVQAFDDRASRYETGYRGQLHTDIVTRAVDLALAHCPSPARVLDVGCGTGLLLRRLARRLPGAVSLTGIDAAAGMIRQARTKSDDPRLTFVHGTAERLPFDDASFDLVISTTSFDHWADQHAGLAECHRVLASRGSFLLADLCSSWLLPTLVGSRRHRARTPLRATKLLAAAGFRSMTWHRLYGGIIRAVTASASG